MKTSELILLVKDVLGSGGGAILLKEWYNNVRKIGYSSDKGEILWSVSKQNFVIHLMDQVNMSDQELASIIKQETQAEEAAKLTEKQIDGDLFDE